MFNLGNTIPQCSMLYMEDSLKGAQAVEGGGQALLLSGKNNVILPVGYRGGLREMCLFILKGGKIQ